MSEDSLKGMWNLGLLPMEKSGSALLVFDVSGLYSTEGGESLPINSWNSLLQSSIPNNIMGNKAI